MHPSVPHYSRAFGAYLLGFIIGMSIALNAHEEKFAGHFLYAPGRGTSMYSLVSGSSQRSTSSARALRVRVPLTTRSSAASSASSQKLVTPEDKRNERRMERMQRLQLRPAAPVLVDDGGFPAFQYATFPVSRIPDWGAMRTPAEWTREYDDLPEAVFVPVPSYDLDVLTTPLSSLTNPITDRTIPLITAKLFYSTRFFGKYDLDAGEFTGKHSGVDLMLARGTPVGAVAGGRVSSVSADDRLGLHVIIEHRHPTDGTFYSIYGHLDSVSVDEGQDVSPGTIVGKVGMTGNTSAPHLHLQIDRGASDTLHVQYLPETRVKSESEDGIAVHPIHFIQKY